MRVAVCTKINHIELQERPIPPIDSTSVLVRVTLCGICGSDVAAWQGRGYQRYPCSPGHEFCGIIEKMGKKVTGLSLGQSVVIDPNLGCGYCPFCRMGKPNLCDHLKTRPVKSNGGLADYVALDYRMVHPLPEELPSELAIFVEPLSCALHAVNSAEIKSKEPVAVFGAGLMGYLTGIVLRSIAAKAVFVEPAENRRRRITEFLHFSAVSPEEADGSEWREKIGVAFDWSGSIHAIIQAVKMLRKAGRLVLGGLVAPSEGCEIPWTQITVRELKIYGVWLNPNTFPSAIRLVAAARADLEKLDLITCPLDQIREAFIQAADPRASKVLVKP